MTRFFKHFLRWVYLNSSPNSTPFQFCCSYNVKYHLKFYCVMTLNVAQNQGIKDSSSSNHGGSTSTLPRISPSTKKQAHFALLDYLHSTRGLPFPDAEHMSKNSPQFLRKLIENVSFETDIRRSMARFLRYHPINEFEPFFESIGLDPCVFLPFLRHDLMFLSDESRLLDSCFVLCQYGVARQNIGKIYRKAREEFHECNGGLKSMLRGFEEVGVSKPVIAKAVYFNPHLLNDGKGVVFFKLVGKLQCLGCEYDWIERNLLENGLYNWAQIFEVFNFASGLVCNDHELRNLVRQHPELLFDHSGKWTFTLIGLLVKLGCPKTEISSLLLQFPEVKVGNFVRNIGRAFELLNEIEMHNVSIGYIIRAHLVLLGSCPLKKAASLLHFLNTGKRQMREIIRENPLVLKNWVLGAKVERLPENGVMRSRNWKIEFFSRIGFSGNSKQLERALKLFRGRREELQERYECLIEAGLSEEDVAHMIKLAPQTLGQSKEVIEAKIRYFVIDLGHPVSSLAALPRYLSHSIERVKLRSSMYKWLVDQNAVPSSLALITLIICKESYFVKRYVNKHPGGLDVWLELKKTFSK